VLGSRSPIEIQGQNLDSQYSYQKKERPMYYVAKVLCPIRLPPTRQLFKQETDRHIKYRLGSANGA
jgi:hypothetical protein